jgi:uncharacterized membrane protein HdeD (DUF308 family)
MLSTVAEVESLTRNWWAVLLRGIAGILFGVITALAPGVTLAVLVLVFGAYAFVDGVLAIASAVRHHARGSARIVLVEGIAGMIAGIITLAWPGITAIALLFVIAAWALVTGVLEVAVAIRLRKTIAQEWLLVLAGLSSIALGVLLFLYPAAGALALVLWIGAYAFVSGVLFVALGIRLGTWGRSHGARPAFGHT